MLWSRQSSIFFSSWMAERLCFDITQQTAHFANYKDNVTETRDHMQLHMSKGGSLCLVACACEGACQNLGLLRLLAPNAGFTSVDHVRKRPEPSLTNNLHSRCSRGFEPENHVNVVMIASERC